MTPVHLDPKGLPILRNSDRGRAYPLNEPGQPHGGALRTSIIPWLNVEVNLRYKPEATSTYCNIYACDVAYLFGAYLPRVWWIHPETATAETPVKYALTVAEMNANALYDWLVEYGAAFGWQSISTPEEGQSQADIGKLVVICAAKKEAKQSGHISVIVAQGPSSLQPTQMVAGKFVPIQSQAGRKNYCYSCDPGRWWEKPNYRGFGIWSHS